jgi:hypothetical protein
MPEKAPGCEWIGFNYAFTKSGNPHGLGLHFFLDDYQFQRVWREPKRYIEAMKPFDAVLTPDFSLYTDYPVVMMIYNHFRKHWLGAMWQAHGLKVIPTISWAGEDSFKWCFDGEPTHAAVAVSSVGTQDSETGKIAFLRGYNAMLERLEPESILFFGKVPAGARGNIIPCPAFSERFNERKKANGR